MTVLWLDHTNCPAWVLQSLHVVVSTWSHWAAPLGVFKGHQTSFLWWKTDRKLPSSSLVTNHIASHRPANTRFYNGLWRTHTRASNEPPRSLKLYKLRILSCALMKGLASMILNRDSYCDDTDNQMLSLNVQNCILFFNEVGNFKTVQSEQGATFIQFLLINVIQIFKCWSQIIIPTCSEDIAIISDPVTYNTLLKSTNSQQWQSAHLLWRLAK